MAAPQIISPLTAEPKLPLADPVLADWRWVHVEAARGAFAAYQGSHIAVIGQQVVGHGTDQLTLRQETASRLGIDPDRVVVFYVDGSTSPGESPHADHSAECLPG